MSFTGVRHKKHNRRRIARLNSGGGNWNFTWRPHTPSWKPSPKQVRLIIILVLGISTLFIADQGAKGVYPGTPSHPSPLDPNTILWQATNPGSDGSEFNLNGFVYRSSCRGSTNCIQSFDSGKPQWTTLTGYNQCSPCAGSTSGSIGVAVNDFLIATFTVSSNGGPSGCTITPTDTLGLTWTSQQCVTIIASATQAIWTAKATATSGSDAVTFTGVNGGAAVQVLLTSFTGEQSIGVVANENNGGVAVNGAFTTTVSITPTTAGWAVFEVLSDEDCSFNGTFTYNNGQTEVHNLGGGGGCGDSTEVSGTATSAQSFGINANHVNSRKYNHAGLIFYGTGTSHPAISITKGQVGDLSTAGSKVLGLNITWANPTWGSLSSFGMFLTTNSSTSVGTGWKPSTDASILYLLNFSCTSLCNTANSVYRTELSFLKSLGASETIQSEMVAGNTCGGASSCFLAGGGTQNGNPAAVFNYGTQLLNFTAGNKGEGCTFTNFSTITGGACNFSAIGAMPAGTPTVNSRTFLPWLSLNSPVYLGFYQVTPATGQVQFGFQNLDVFLFTAPASTSSPNIPDAGFFGPIVKALINIFIFAFNAFLSFIAFIGPGVTAALAVIESFLINGLNAVGNAAGLGNIGTDVSAILGQFITYFTSFSPTVFNNLPALFGRFLDTLSFVFPWLPTALSIALNIATLGINAMLFIPTLVGFIFQFVSAGFVIYFILFWFLYTGDDSLGGALAFFESAEWLVFGVGVKYITKEVNFAIDIITALVGLIPKPFIQMAAHAFPRIPTVEVNAHFVNPALDLGEIASGNLFSMMLWMAGITFLDWYESVTPALPGSIGALLPSAAGQLTWMAGFLNLLEVLTALVSIAAFLMVGINSFARVGLDLGASFLPAGPGRRISGGPGSLSIGKSGKRFQGRLERKIEQRKEFGKDLKQAEQAVQGGLKI